MAVTPDPDTYAILEDKWRTFEFCRRHAIPTPHTELLDLEGPPPEFPCFLKIASGTSGGRGVWRVQGAQEMRGILRRLPRKKILLTQCPAAGRVIVAQVIYDCGRVTAFFFARSVNPADLAGTAKNFLRPRRHSASAVSHERAELKEDEWQAVTHIIGVLGTASGYHGMLDVEFILGPKVLLLEVNPRFSGAVHASLSHPGFLDAYFDLVHGEAEGNVRNFSRGVEMRARFLSFQPVPFFARNWRQVVHLRDWERDRGMEVGVKVEADGEVDVKYGACGVEGEK
uniref:ATP-grasp domain-containing protein n=1 Tax=Corethron hystrix TaxID=216773 RepID=A0A7S1BBZ9_9STRA|mmetsp:Transcript_21211/g.48151  ORF Transcript_21211/g.48151 Transcript_21211/m.48151 type:complete len:284 (+) Transcript_21211:1296-2147(+)